MSDESSDPKKERKIRIQVDGEWRFVQEPPQQEVVSLDSSSFLIRNGGAWIEIFLTPEGKYSDGNTLDGIDLQVESLRETLLRERFGGSVEGRENGDSAATLTIKSPMPGLVRSILVQVGDTVEKNATLLVLEAMKMENNISSNAGGRVKSILVSAGMTVDKNARLIELERLP